MWITIPSFNSFSKKKKNAQPSPTSNFCTVPNRKPFRNFECFWALFSCVQAAGIDFWNGQKILGVSLHQTFNPNIQQLETHTAEITPSFCLDLSLITPAFSLPAPTYIPCGDSHLSLLTPGMPPWPNRQLFVLGGVKPLSRLLLIGLRRLLLSVRGYSSVLQWRGSLAVFFLNHQWYRSFLWYSFGGFLYLWEFSNAGLALL